MGDGTDPTSLEFARQVSGEWEGRQVVYDAHGKSLAIPEYLVPDEFREYNVTLYELTTQASMTVETAGDESTLLWKLVRQVPQACTPHTHTHTSDFLRGTGHIGLCRFDCTARRALYSVLSSERTHLIVIRSSLRVVVDGSDRNYALQLRPEAPVRTHVSFSRRSAHIGMLVCARIANYRACAWETC